MPDPRACAPRRRPITCSRDGNPAPEFLFEAANFAVIVRARA